MTRTTTIALLCCLLAGVATADELYTTDGRKLSGKLIDQGDFWLVKMSFGSVKVAKSDVARIVRKQTDAERYERKRREIDPQDADGWHRLALWCRSQKLEPFAVRAAKKAIELDSEHAGARKLLGQVKVGERWVDEAQAARLKADLEADRMRAAGKVRLGNQWVSPAAYKEAFRQAVALYNQGNQALRAGQARQAVERYEQALARFPGFDLARLRIALAYLYMKQGARAVGTLRRMIKDDPENATLHYNLGVAYQTLKRYGPALEAYRRALAIEPRRQDAMQAAIDLARFLKRAKELQQLEVQRAENLKEALIGLYRAALPAGYALVITLQDRPIKINKRVLERTATGGLKPVLQTMTGKQTPLSNEKAKAYGHQVTEPLAIDSKTFLAHNTRLRTVSTYPVLIDDFRQAGWAFAFRNAPHIRLKILRLSLEQDGKPVKPAGRLALEYFTYRRIDYRDGRVVDGEREINLTLWRKMAAGDWPEPVFLAVPSCIADCVGVELALEDGTTIREAFVYDHERGVVRQVPAADWRKAATAAKAPPAGARSARQRAIKLYRELRASMGGFKQQGTDPKAAAVRTFVEGWIRRVQRLYAEAIDPDVRLALEDMRTLLRELEADLGGGQADRIDFFAGEIERQLGIKQ